MQFTPSQQKAVDFYGKNILVSAGAGSGKTAVLTERIVKAVAEGKCGVDEILVVTFTRAAASEMKKRIRDKLFSLYRENRGNTRLSAQIAKMDAAQISTFHSFCLNTVKKYYYAAGTDPAFTLLGDAEQKYLIDEAIETLFNAYYEAGDPDFAYLEDNFNDVKNMDGLKNLILQLYRFARRKKEGLSWIEASACDFDITDEAAFDALPVIKQAKDYIGANLAQIMKPAKAMEKLCAMYDNEEGDWSIFAANEISQIEALSNCLNGSFTDFLSALKTVKLPNFIRKESDAKEEIKKLHGDVRDAVNKLKALFGFGAGEYVRFMRESSAGVHKLVEAVVEFDKIYGELKQKRGAADFSDLEHWCIKVLGDEECLNEIRNSYKYVFVDEYQDTNYLQEYVLTKVAQSGALFAVGDVKQSIYSFNDAEPKIFMSRYDKAVAGDAGEELIIMAENFRTQKPVINAVNELFSVIMTRETGGIDYAPTQALIAAIDTPVAYKPEIHAVISDEVNEEQKYLTSLEREAAYVAKLAGEMIGSDIYDSKTDTVRKAEPSDIAILARNMNSAAETFSRALRAQGIISCAAEASSFYDSVEISLMMNMLKVTDNRADDIPLLSVMRSYVFSFSPDELLKIRLHSPDLYFYYDCVNEYRVSGEDEALKTKLEYMYSRLDAYAAVARHKPLEELIRTIYSTSNIYRITGALPNPEARRSNLLHFCALASDYEKNTGKGLYSFIRYAESAREKGDFKGDGKNENNGGVKIMTVHKSKGLEFPIVIVAECGKSYINKNTVAADRDIGICPKYMNAKEFYKASTLQNTIAAAKAKAERTAEEMRILYVAATRAQARLVFTGTLSAKAFEEYSHGAELNSIENANSFMQLILRGAAASDKWIINRIGADTEERAAQSEAAEVCLNTAPEEEAPETKEDAAEKVKALLNYVYPYMTDALIPSKLTVTSLKNNELMPAGEKVIAINDEALFAGEEHALTPMQAGTAVHKFLQKLDFATDSEEDLKFQLEALTQKGIFTHQEAEAVNTGAIADFLAREPGCLIKDAEEVKREMPFILQLDPAEADESWSGASRKILLQGIIDCVFIREGKTYLLDYKTDKYRARKSFDETHEGYKKQIALYDKALAALTGKAADERYICYLNMGRFVKV